MAHNFDKWMARAHSMEQRVDEACIAAGHKNVVVIYSAYALDADEYQTDNLDEVAAEGTFRLFSRHDDFWGKGKDYLSEEEITNPTWLQVAVHANASIHVTGDYHHVFLEGVEVNGNRLIMHFGS